MNKEECKRNGGCGKSFSWGVGTATCGFFPDVLCEECKQRIKNESQEKTEERNG